MVKKKTIPLLLLVFLFVVGCVSTGAEKSSNYLVKIEVPPDAKRGPEIILLGSKKPAILTHQEHQTRMKCDHCHTGNTPKLLASEQKAAHKVCVGCHRSIGWTVACKSCHT